MAKPDSVQIALANVEEVILIVPKKPASSVQREKAMILKALGEVKSQSFR